MNKFSTFFVIVTVMSTFSWALAQEEIAQVSVIADVNLVNQTIVKQDNRLFTIGVNIQNKIGTQNGVMYGVQAYETIEGKKVLVDEFAVLDPLSIKQNEYVYKEFAYPLPASLGQSLELFAFLKTDTGILLSLASLGEVTVPAQEVPVDLGACSLDVVKKELSCALRNLTNNEQSVVLSSQVKSGNSAFAPLSKVFAPQTITLKSRERREIVQSVDNETLLRDAFFETVLIDSESGSLLERTTLVYTSPTQKRTVDNVLIEQTDMKNYTVKVIALGRSQGEKARISIASDTSICATQDIMLSTPIAEAVFVLEKPCDTTLISTSILDESGAVIDVFEVKHQTLFPEKKNDSAVLLLVGLALLVGGYLFARYRASSAPIKA